MTRVSVNQLPTATQYQVLRVVREALDRAIEPTLPFKAGQAVFACVRRGWLTGRPGERRLTNAGGQAMVRYERRFAPITHTPAHEASMVVA